MDRAGKGDRSGRNFRSVPGYISRMLLPAVVLITVFIHAAYAAIIPGMASRLRISVTDRNSETISDAIITARAESGKEVRARYDNSMGLYVFDNDLHGSVRLKISRRGFESQQIVLPEDFDQDIILIQLGVPGDSYSYVDSFKRPFTSHPDKLGVIFSTTQKDKVEELLDELGLRGERVMGEMMIISRDKPFDRFNDDVLRKLRASPVISHAGPVAGLESHPRILTNSIIVGFRPDIPNEEWEKVIRKHGLQIRNRIVGNIYVLSADDAVGEGIIDIMEKLIPRREVLSVSENSAAIVPADLPRYIPGKQ